MNKLLLYYHSVVKFIIAVGCMAFLFSSCASSSGMSGMLLGTGNSQTMQNRSDLEK